MLKRLSGMRNPWRSNLTFALAILFSALAPNKSYGQDYGSATDSDTPEAPPKEVEHCNGIFISYSFQGREKEYPLVKNVSAQAWSFQAMVTVLNAGSEELKSWQVFVGFQHHELLVSADGAVVVDGEGFPVRVGNNGTILAGYPQADLKTAIDTAADYTQMQVQVNLKGTMFGVSAKATPMPRALRLVNQGYKCPAATRKSGYMYVCCKKDPKFKSKAKKTKFLPRQYGDLDFTYDVLQAYENKYLAQVTLDNNHPLGRLDQWNLTWEWMRNEFIYSMRGAYTHHRDPSECIYGPQGQYYKDFDFSTVVTCEKHPVIADLPPESANDDKIGRLPFCCNNGTLLPKTMNETKSRAIFQLEVFKLPPDMNRTALNPPQNWKIQGRLNPTYKCGPPIRVDPSQFPDPRGIDATTSAIASWRVTCNMTRPKPKAAKCCVSYSAYYSDAAVPCPTCACGCDPDDEKPRCDANANPLLLPTSALLVPFANRTEKALAFARIKHRSVPRKLPCPDNCGVSINWHIDSDYKKGWTARLTLFNWDDYAFADWYTAVQLKKARPGFDKVYSFNGTELGDRDRTIFMQGMPGLNYLVGEVNGTHPDRDPRVPGKQQSVISFTKKGITHVNVPGGDGFPSKVFFNGEECALPKELPKRNGASRASGQALFTGFAVAALTFLVLGVGQSMN
ncbi:COBRA-like protein 10 [Striga hermonthica]|uniref:COBRA-like protein 10 n=1 Tax=Striga hermonthica TaxID=68872 RepID=A0A9N7N2D5_STRHE|nr:COBRA-like protein 10 [Striga hermonthica]